MPGSSPGMTTECAERSRLRKLVPSIPLRIEQRGEVAVVDPCCRRSGYGGLGVIGDPQARLLDHAEVVGAVADNKRIDLVEIEGFGEFDQGRKLCRAPQDRLFDLAGE